MIHHFELIVPVFVYVNAVHKYWEIYSRAINCYLNVTSLTVASPLVITISVDKLSSMVRCSRASQDFVIQCVVTELLEEDACADTPRRRMPAEFEKKLLERLHKKRETCRKFV